MEKRDHSRKGLLARRLVGLPEPRRALRPEARHRAPRVARKSSLLNSIRILENFCTVISSGLLFGLLKREKLTQRL